MRKLFILFAGSVFVLLVISATNLMAQQRGHGKPPFVTACEGKSEGDACSYTDRSGSTKSDTCQSITNPRGESELACGQPSMPPRGEKGNPPQRQ